MLENPNENPLTAKQLKLYFTLTDGALSVFREHNKPDDALPVVGVLDDGDGWSRAWFITPQALADSKGVHGYEIQFDGVTFDKCIEDAVMNTLKFGDDLTITAENSGSGVERVEVDGRSLRRINLEQLTEDAKVLLRSLPEVKPQLTEKNAAAVASVAVNPEFPVMRGVCASMVVALKENGFVYQVSGLRGDGSDNLVHTFERAMPPVPGATGRDAQTLFTRVKLVEQRHPNPLYDRSEWVTATRESLGDGRYIDTRMDAASTLSGANYFLKHHALSDEGKARMGLISKIKKPVSRPRG